MRRNKIKKNTANKRPLHTSEYVAFSKALSDVLTVSHSDMAERLKSEKEEKAHRIKSS
jgi:hypothetical protein